VPQGLVHFLAKCHRAHANGRDMQVALTELNGFHGLAGRKHGGKLQSTLCKRNTVSFSGSGYCLFIIPAMYQVKRPARSEFVPVRNLSYHVLVLGDASGSQNAAGVATRLDGCCGFIPVCG